jgi:single-stranded-DNA-specific exonuclease
MIGDSMEKSIDKLNNLIINDGEVKKKRGLLIYPSTRPLNRTLEYCSDPYIPGITGNSQGIIQLLREVGLNPINNGKYKSLIELNNEEMSKLVTAIVLKNPKVKNREIIGDIFLIKFFNKLEDARELSAIINACSRLGEPETAMQFCMELLKAKKKAELIHTRYKQFIISALKFVSESEKIEGNGFVIINAKEKIKDTIIGTIASILSNSSIYEEGTIITTMAYYDDKIKVSSRSVGKNGKNVREILTSVIEKIGGEVGGHESAAGCMFKQDKEKEFLDYLKKSLEIELVKI